MKRAMLALAVAGCFAGPSVVMLAAEGAATTAPAATAPAGTAPGSTTGSGAATQAATAVAATPKALAETVAAAIKLLEAGKNGEAIELLMEPTVLTEAKAGDWPRLVNDFGEVRNGVSRASRVLAMLKEVRAATPVLSDEGKRATYESATGKPKFVMHEERWYLEGH